MAFGAAFAVALGAALAVVAAVFFGAALVAVALDALALALLGFAAALVAGALVGAATTAAFASAAFAAAASARAVLLSAARALPAAVWAPLALPALPAAMRALAAFWAASLAGRLGDVSAGLDRGPAEGRVDLAGQARLATRGGVRMDGAGLGRAVEGAEGVDQGGVRVDRRVGRSRGDGQGLRDVRLRGAAARLEDLVAALGLTDALES